MFSSWFIYTALCVLCVCGGERQLLTVAAAHTHTTTTAAAASATTAEHSRSSSKITPDEALKIKMQLALPKKTVNEAKVTLSACLRHSDDGGGGGGGGRRGAQFEAELYTIKRTLVNEKCLFAWLALLSSAHVRNVDHIQSWRDLSGDSDRESAKNGRNALSERYFELPRGAMRLSFALHGRKGEATEHSTIKAFFRPCSTHKTDILLFAIDKVFHLNRMNPTVERVFSVAEIIEAFENHINNNNDNNGIEEIVESLVASHENAKSLQSFSEQKLEYLQARCAVNGFFVGSLTAIIPNTIEFKNVFSWLNKQKFNSVSPSAAHLEFSRACVSLLLFNTPRRLAHLLQIVPQSVRGNNQEQQQQQQQSENNHFLLSVNNNESHAQRTAALPQLPKWIFQFARSKFGDFECTRNADERDFKCKVDKTPFIQQVKAATAAAAAAARNKEEAAADSATLDAAAAAQMYAWLARACVFPREIVHAVMSTERAYERRLAEKFAALSVSRQALRQWRAEVGRGGGGGGGGGNAHKRAAAAAADSDTWQSNSAEPVMLFGGEKGAGEEDNFTYTEERHSGGGGGGGGARKKRSDDERTPVLRALRTSLAHLRQIMSTCIARYGIDRVVFDTPLQEIEALDVNEDDEAVEVGQGFVDELSVNDFSRESSREARKAHKYVPEPEPEPEFNKGDSLLGGAFDWWAAAKQLEDQSGDYHSPLKLRQQTKQSENVESNANTALKAKLNEHKEWIKSRIRDNNSNNNNNNNNNNKVGSVDKFDHLWLLASLREDDEEKQRIEQFNVPNAVQKAENLNVNAMQADEKKKTKKMKDKNNTNEGKMLVVNAGTERDLGDNGDGDGKQSTKSAALKSNESLKSEKAKEGKKTTTAAVIKEIAHVDNWLHNF